MASVSLSRRRCANIHIMTRGNSAGPRVQMQAVTVVVKASYSESDSTGKMVSSDELYSSVGESGAESVEERVTCAEEEDATGACGETTVVLSCPAT